MKKKIPKKPTTPRYKLANKVVKSDMLKLGMESDPFVFGTKGSPTQNQVSFASELGRRGSEVLGLGTGPSSTSIINSAVARKRSRHAVLTNPYAKRAVDVMVNNVVGTGHRLISTAPDAVFKKQVEDLWESWSSFVDTSGKLNWSGFEALAFRSMLEGGDCFIRLRVRRPEDGLPVPLQLQIYESEQVPVTKNEMNGLNKVVAGIEFDSLDRASFYHMYRNHPGEFFLMQVNQGSTPDTVKIPAGDIIHLHDVKRPNEIRGIPLLSQALIKLSDLDRYMDAELVRKKAAALIGGFIKEPADGNNASNPFITEESGGEGDKSKDVHIEAIEPGSFPVLPPGYDVSFSNPADVGGNFKEFLRQQLMMIAASINETYEQLTGDMSNVNDRSLRANMLEFKRMATNFQEHILVHQFCRTIFIKWFDLALLSGKLKIPKGMSPEDARKVRWIADPWPYMNPQQEVNTQITEIRGGLKSRSEIITERGGIPEEVDKQIKSDRDREKANDLVYTSNAGVVSDAGVAHAVMADPSLTLVNDASADNNPAPSNGGNNAP